MTGREWWTFDEGEHAKKRFRQTNAPVMAEEVFLEWVRASAGGLLGLNDILGVRAALDIVRQFAQQHGLQAPTGENEHWVLMRSDDSIILGSHGPHASLTVHAAYPESGFVCRWRTKERKHGDMLWARDV